MNHSPLPEMSPSSDAPVFSPPAAPPDDTGGTAPAVWGEIVDYDDFEDDDFDDFDDEFDDDFEEELEDEYTLDEEFGDDLDADGTEGDVEEFDDELDVTGGKSEKIVKGRDDDDDFEDEDETFDDDFEDDA